MTNEIVEGTIETAVIDNHPHFSWSAVTGSAVTGVGVTLALLVLGSGFGLALLPERSVGAHVSAGFFSLGAAYFVACVAFGMAAAGHMVGRLIGAQIETSNEENFRAGAHGLATWALSIVITLVLVAISAAVAERSAIRLSELYGARLPAPAMRDDAEIAYLVDVLFRPQSGNPPAAGHASLDYTQFAQADTQQGTDAGTAPPQGTQDNNGNGVSQQPSSQQGEEPGGQSNPPADLGNSNQNNNSGSDMRSRVLQHVPGDLEPSPPPTNPLNPGQLQADKAEITRMLQAANGNDLTVEDRDRIAQLVAQDANLSYEAATGRANDIQARLKADRKAMLDEARKTGSFVAFWLAAALIFGALVSVVAAVSARWEDDMQAMFAFRRA